MLTMKRFLALGIVVAGLLTSAQVFAATTGKCLNAAPDNECFQDLVLDVGGSTVIDIDKPTKQMKFVTSDDKIIDVRPFKEDKLYIRGKEVGHGTLTVFDQSNGKTVAKIEVDVKPLSTVTDLSSLKRQIAKNFPGQDINVEATQKGVVLYGTVTGSEIVEQVLRLTDGYLSSITGGVMTSDQRVITLPSGQTIVQDAGGETATGRSGKKIINLLKVGGPQQVLLEVKFAEVNRDSAKEFQAGFALADIGNNITGGWSSNRSTVLEATQFRSNSLFGNIPLLPNIFAIKPDDWAIFLRFIEEENLGRVLAEPKLVTMSGQEASFLAGGEFPYQTVEDNDVNIEFKEFGVGLRFTPVVGSDGMITLKVAPSVSDIVDYVETDIGAQPILSTRKLDSMVQLRDGQTLALAGLLSERLGETARKVPLLGDIPILGMLFRSTEFQNKKTDLMIAVTPHLVKPVKEGLLSFPGEYVKKPNQFEFYLLGKLEGIRSENDASQLPAHRFAMPAATSGGGMEGSFGHMESAR